MQNPNTKVKNYIILCAKYFIFLSKCRNTIPWINNFTNYLYKQIDIEKHIAQENDQLESHENKSSFLIKQCIAITCYVILYVNQFEINVIVNHKKKPMTFSRDGIKGFILLQKEINVFYLRCLFYLMFWIYGSLCINVHSIHTFCVRSLMLLLLILYKRFIGHILLKCVLIKSV